MRGRRIRMAVHAHAHLRKVVEILGCPRHELLAGLSDHLTRILSFRAGESGYLSGNQVTELAHERGTLRCGQTGPLGKCRFGSRHRSVDLHFAAARDLSQRLLSRRIDGLKVFRTGDWLAVNEMMNLHADILTSASERHVRANGIVQPPKPVYFADDLIAGQHVLYPFGRAREDEISRSQGHE